MLVAWNAIVKNEAANIERCVRSLLPHIDCAVVLDTGSTDGTQGILERLFREHGKPIVLQTGEFVNFKQTRNEALLCARESGFHWDYLLLSDADMELQVTDPNWKRHLNGGPSYDLKQIAGGNLVYWNRRLVSRYAKGGYECVTHEYLDIPTAGGIEGAYFIDHASGANRPGKLDKDIALIEEALKTETRPGIVQRYHFYLAQSYFDKGDWAKAAEHYKLRAELGGWDEEVWNAQLHYAHALGNLGDNPGFVWNMIQAYALRPSRAEVLYDLAKWFRERGQNHASLLFSDPGQQIPLSNDQLFVNRYVYDVGCREEFAICAFYDPDRRERGAAIADAIALEKTATAFSREQARANLYWYLQPLAELVPSFKPTKIAFPDHDGYVPMNPSVVNLDGTPVVLVRTVNYTIVEGRYEIRSPDGNSTGNFYPIDTRNFLVRLGAGGDVERVQRINYPANLHPPQFDLVLGLEDSRIFVWCGKLWSLSTARCLNPSGSCEQVLAELEEAGDDLVYSANWSKLLPKPPLPQANEKNWMPWVCGDELRFVYRLGTLVAPSGEIIVQHENPVDCGHISGGSPVIEVAPRVFLAIVHEARAIPGSGLRFYQHRFARLAADGSLIGLSRPFFFAGRQIEFAAGLAYWPLERKLMVSYGVCDREAWVATMGIDDVLKLFQ